MRGLARRPPHQQTFCQQLRPYLVAAGTMLMPTIWAHLLAHMSTADFYSYLSSSFIWSPFSSLIVSFYLLFFFIYFSIFLRISIHVLLLSLPFSSVSFFSFPYYFSLSPFLYYFLLLSSFPLFLFFCFDLYSVSCFFTFLRFSLSLPLKRSKNIHGGQLTLAK